jgi:transcription elongation factor Elf1
MAIVDDTTNCPVCGLEAQRDLNTNTNEMTLACGSCGFYAETEIVDETTGHKFWLETKYYPMNDLGKVQRDLRTQTSTQQEQKSSEVNMAPAPTGKLIANTNDEDDLKLTITNEATEERAMAHRASLEQAGRFGIVSWTNNDIITALENAGTDPTPENIEAVREHYCVRHIDERMTETGWAVIEEAISDLRLVTRGLPNKESGK